MKECGPFIVDEVAYKKLNDEINQFYDKSYKDAHEVKPVTVEEGQVKLLLYCADRIICYLHWSGYEVSKIHINLFKYCYIEQ